MKQPIKRYKMLFITQYEYDDGSSQKWTKELWYTSCVSEKQAISRTAYHLRQKGIYQGVGNIRGGCVRKWIEAKLVEA